MLKRYPPQAFTLPKILLLQVSCACIGCMNENREAISGMIHSGKQEGMVPEDDGRIKSLLILTEEQLLLEGYHYGYPHDHIPV